MTTTFTGEVRIPGSIENGLPSTITLDAQTLILTAGGTELGRWNRSELQLRREPDGTFHLTLGREIVLFNPDSPLEFAILSGMPGAGTVPPPPASAPEPEPAAPVVAPEPSPVAAQPAVTPPAASAPAAVPPPAAAHPPAASEVPPAPQPDAPPPVSPPPAATLPPAPPATAEGPPAVASPAAATPPPAVQQPAAAPVAPPPLQVTESAVLPAASPAAAAAAAAAATIQTPAAHPEPVEIRLETDEAAPPNVEPPAPPATPAPTQPRQAPPLPSPGEAAPQAQPGSGDFWDGFHAEEQEAGVAPAVPSAEAMPAAIDESPAEIRLELSDEHAEPDRVGGYGSGLFTEEEATPPPAFGGGAGAGDEGERSWSDDDGDDDTAEDRGWSYDDPTPEVEVDEEEETPEFRSPAADRDELVEKSSRLKDIAAWRPSVPRLGGSELGMRARDAISVLDALLEENGTEDIPRSFLIGLGVLAVVLTLVVILALVF